jgi:hypothetical protein
VNKPTSNSKPRAPPASPDEDLELRVEERVLELFEDFGAE